MNYSVLRKFLSTTSLLAVSAVLSACSGEIERFGTPGSGYTANQNDIFTNSTANAPVQSQVSQPMPNVVASAPKPVYVSPQPTYNSPKTVYVNPQPVTAQRQQVAAVRNPAPVLLTNSINKSATPVPVSYQPMPPLPGNAQQNVDYTSTGSIKTAQSNQPTVISRFESLPKNAPRSKKTIDYTQTASVTPPASIPNTQYVQVPSPQRTQVASAAPMSLQTPRTSGHWTSVGGTMVNVLPGEDINLLSQRYGVPAKAIADVNNLPSNGALVSGQRILIPVYQQQRNETYPARQQVAALNNPTNVVPTVVRVPKANPLRLQSRTPYAQQVSRMQQSANAERRHMVMPGDTLSGIASRYNVSTAQLARANGLTATSHIRMGQRLHIPQSTQSTPVDYTATASINQQPSYRVPVNAPVTSSTPVTQPTLRLTKVPKSKPRQLVQQAVQQINTGSTSPVAALPKAKRRNQVASVRQAVGLPDPVASDANKVTTTGSVNTPTASQSHKFRWPVRGRIISSYGRKRDGSRNDGINLAVPIGTSVRVAESGTVIYAGDKLKGYGNLVLVQHSNGWVTAYAHNEKVMVSKGQQVRRGQIIAQAGKSGNVEAPQVHFELRIKGDPVDPVPYLVSS